MRYRSKKQQRAYDEHGPARVAFLQEMQYRCALCGVASLDFVRVHEMTNGPNRMIAFGRREAWLPACNICNCEHFTDKAAWPLNRQLVLKIECDPGYFNLDVINEIMAPCKGRVVHVVTAAEVLAFLVEMKLTPWRN